MPTLLFQSKCATYFPDSAGPESAVVCGDFSVTMTKRDVHQEYITSWLQLKMLKVADPFYSIVCLFVCSQLKTLEVALSI